MTHRGLIFAALALALAGEPRSAVAQVGAAPEDASKAKTEKVREVGGGFQVKGEVGDLGHIIHKVRLNAGKSYIITMTSQDPKALDPYLLLLDATGKKLTEDDDSAGNQNAMILFEAPA